MLPWNYLNTTPGPPQQGSALAGESWAWRAACSLALVLFFSSRADLIMPSLLLSFWMPDLDLGHVARRCASRGDDHPADWMKIRREERETTQWMRLIFVRAPIFLFRETLLSYRLSWRLEIMQILFILTLLTPRDQLCVILICFHHCCSPGVPQHLLLW